jgi:Trypsin
MVSVPKAGKSKIDGVQHISITILQVATVVWATLLQSSSAETDKTYIGKSDLNKSWKESNSHLGAVERITHNSLSGCTSGGNGKPSSPLFVSKSTNCPCFLSYTVGGDIAADWDIFFMTTQSYQEWRKNIYVSDPTYEAAYSTILQSIPSSTSFQSQQFNIWQNGSYTLAIRATASTQVCIVNGNFVFESMLPACPVVVDKVSVQKIVGGSTVSNFDDPVYGFNWIALILWSGRYPICGGSHIAPGYILTAGHCNIQTNINMYSVRLGNVDASSGKLFKIRRMWVHPQFTELPNGEVVNDIAILEISKRDKSLDSHVIEWSRDSTVPRTGDFVTTAGFGEISEKWGAFPEPNLMRRVDLPTWNTASCKAIYRDLQVDQHICAGYREGKCDSCQYVFFELPQHSLLRIALKYALTNAFGSCNILS